MSGFVITELYAENIKRIRAVRIRPGGEGPVVTVSGANGSGKSSVLDAIVYALCGKAAIDPEPIRTGEKAAVIRLDLGSVIVTRRFTEKEGRQESTLLVESADGARFPSPQKMLDDLLGSSTLLFDPVAFERMDAKARLLELRKVAPVDPEADRLDNVARVAFERRTTVNRNIRDLEGQLAGLAQPDADLPLEEPNIDGLLHELGTVNEHNSAIRLQREGRDRRAREAEAMRKSAEEFQREAEELLARAASYVTMAANIDAELATMPALEAERDVAEVSARLDAARTIERRVRAAAEYRATAERLQAAKATEEALTTEITTAREKVRAIVAATPMPVEGLAFGDEDVTFKGHPFAQASAAERIRVALGIAMAGNPKLRVLRIKDGSLLDERSLALVADAATARGFQVWIERVDTSGRVGVVMVDGEIEGAGSPSEEAGG